MQCEGQTSNFFFVSYFLSSGFTVQSIPEAGIPGSTNVVFICILNSSRGCTANQHERLFSQRIFNLRKTADLPLLNFSSSFTGSWLGLCRGWWWHPSGAHMTCGCKGFPFKAILIWDTPTLFSPPGEWATSAEPHPGQSHRVLVPEMINFLGFGLSCTVLCIWSLLSPNWTLTTQAELEWVGILVIYPKY